MKKYFNVAIVVLIMGVLPLGYTVYDANKSANTQVKDFDSKTKTRYEHYIEVRDTCQNSAAGCKNPLTSDQSYAL